MFRTIVAAVILLLAFCCRALGQNSSGSSTVDQLVAKDAEIRMLRANIERLSKQIETLKAELAVLKKDLAKMDSLKRQNEALVAQLKEIESRNRPTAVATANDKADDAASKGIPEPWSGFRGIPWGTSILDVADIRNGRTEGGDHAYSRVGDKLEIGEAKLQAILYRFYDGKFWRVFVLVGSSTNYEALERAVIAKYGPGKESPLGGFKLMKWGASQGNGVAEVSMRLYWCFDTGTGGLEITHEPINTRIQADKEEAAKKAKNDF